LSSDVHRVTDGQWLCRAVASREGERKTEGDGGEDTTSQGSTGETRT